MGSPCFLAIRIALPLALAFSLLLLCNVVEGADTLTPGQSIRTWETIVSADGVFELGFYKVDSRYYVGIWYQWGGQKRPLWVANREDPLPDASGSLALGKDGNLAILDRTNTTVWTTGLSISNSSSSSSTAEAVLLNSGNLVLRLGGSSDLQPRRVLWQSFDYPSDTLFPAMRIGIDFNTNKSLRLVSWRGDDDPSPGIFSFGIDPQSLTDAFIWRNSKAIWRSLSWNGKPIGEEFPPVYNFQVSSNTGEVYISYTGSIPEKRGISLVLNPYGQLIHTEEYFNATYDVGIWSSKENMCSTNVCGPYSSCNDNDNPICKCLPGFKPVSEKQWDSGKWDAGCGQSATSGCGNDDGFVQLKKMKIGNMPLHASVNSTLDECKALCLRDCTCVACSYGLIGGSDCALFREELKGLEELREEDGALYQETSSIREPVDLHIRVAASELGLSFFPRAGVLWSALYGSPVEQPIKM